MTAAKTMSLAGRAIGDGAPTYIIAELSAKSNGLSVLRSHPYAEDRRESS